MPIWVQITLGIAGIIVAPLLAHFAAKRGAAVGVAVGLAVHAEKIRSLEEEVYRLRQRYHDHAQHITRHEADIYTLKRKAGLE